MYYIDQKKLDVAAVTTRIFKFQLLVWQKFIFHLMLLVHCLLSECVIPYIPSSKD